MTQTDRRANSWQYVLAIVLILSIAWFLTLLNTKAIRIGDGWQDYLVLRGLTEQIFQHPDKLSEIWHPFLLPAVLLGIANRLSTQGPDFLVAGSILWLLS